MTLTLADRAERRRITKKLHKTKDEGHYRRLNATLLLSQGHSVTTVSTGLPIRAAVNKQPKHMRKCKCNRLQQEYRSSGGIRLAYYK